jgi:hypothetical protein
MYSLKKYQENELYYDNNMMNNISHSQFEVEDVLLSSLSH